MGKIFDTDKKIRLGIWGLGRGSSFVKAADALNIDVVAGCDTNSIMRERFKKNCPTAFVTDDENEFLAREDIDAVLIATYFTSHADHTIRSLEAGKHVMCEVTSFFTPAEGVKVVEAVEKSKKVYHLLENYPFSKENMYLAKLWQEGFFGDFQYGEFEYLHECRSLCYCYNMLGYPPVEPGYAAHNWRSYLDFHYYCTHSLGPLMKITGLRPEKITAFPEKIALPGFIPGSGMAKPCPSLIQMSNGGIMRNLCGATTGNYHTGKRIWGTRASAESLGKHGLHIRFGAGGESTQTLIEPQWPELGEFADTTGHGGGDFWELYYFAREILTGEAGPWNIYDACDVTLAGIMAVRSTENQGETQVIPDFRDPVIRDKYRNDNFSMTRIFEPDRIFPDGHDTAISGNFNKVMSVMEKKSVILRQAVDGAKLYPQIADADGKLKVIQFLKEAIDCLPELYQLRKQAQEMIDAYPDSPAAGALQSMMTLAEPEINDEENVLKDKLLEKTQQLLSK